MAYPATLEDICRLFQRAVAAGDMDAVLDAYDPDAVFVGKTGKVAKAREVLREELAPLMAMKARFAFEIKQVAEADGIALMHTAWTVSAPQPMTSHAIEVARRQPDGSWRWLIGDPFTIGRHTKA